MSNFSSGANRTLYVGAGVGMTMVAGTLSYYFYKYLKRDIMPLKWRRVGTLEQINVFPVKSCAPLELSTEDEVLCEVLGCRLQGIRDRVLMLVDAKHEMITARVYPKMVLIRTKLLGETTLQITGPGMEPLQLDLSKLVEETPGKDVHTSVWGAKIDAMLCGPKYDKWFSRCILGKESGLHLVYYPYPQPVRSTNSELKKEPFIIQEDSGTFCDGTSYMLMNLASVDDLKKRLSSDIDALQFRGNFHLRMDWNEPYAEDKWQWIRIGNDAVFRIVAPCTRCIFTNINVKSGERNPDGEPLKTLKSYRMFKKYSSPALGVHMGLRRFGAIKPNDIIYVEDTTKEA